MLPNEQTPAAMVAGDVIRAETARKGWTLRQLQDATGLSRVAVWRATSGRGNVGSLVYRPIERELELPTYLLTWIRNADIDRVTAVASRLRPDLAEYIIRELTHIGQV